MMKTLPVILFLLGCLRNSLATRTQEFFIAAVETSWDYLYKDNLEPASSQRGPGVQKYTKAVYTEYTDATFKTQKTKPPWAGIQGPTIRATVNDKVIVHFKNFASQPFSISPVGIPYWKQSEGAGYEDSTSSQEKEDDAVLPGGYYKYVWDIHPISGPTMTDPECLTYSYSSQVDAIRDLNSGLVGALLICKSAALTEDRKRNVPEFVLLFAVFDENKSWYTDRGRSGDKLRKLASSQQYHTINGYINSTLPGLRLCQKTKDIFWHLIGLGSAPEIHSIQFQDHTLKVMEHRKVTVKMAPTTFTTAQMKPSAVGKFLISCKIHSHQQDGMSAFFTVEKCSEAEDMPDKQNVKHWTMANEQDGDYADNFDDLVSAIVFPAGGPASVLRSSVKGRPKVWVHYIAVEEITWAYGPDNSNDVSQFPSTSSEYLNGVPHLGNTYKKATYTEYTDKTFTVKKRTSKTLMGPVLRGEVGDQFQIIFRNLATRPFNIYPNGIAGVHPLKKRAQDKPVDLSSLAVPPGETIAYLWKLTPEDGPTEADPRCLMRLYQSTLDPERDLASGLVGPLIICKSDSLDHRGRMVRSDKEKHLMFAVFDENKSWYIEQNIQKYSKDPSRVNANDPDFYDSNIMYNVNGYMSNSLEFQICTGDVTFWHVANVGMQSDFLSVYFTGNTFEKDQVYDTVLTLFPMTAETVSTEMETAGEWEISAFDPNMKKRGMSVRYSVYNCLKVLPLVDSQDYEEYFLDYYEQNMPSIRSTKERNRTVAVKVCKRPAQSRPLPENYQANSTGRTMDGQNKSKPPLCEIKYIPVDTDEDRDVLSQGGIPQNILDELDQEMARDQAETQEQSGTEGKIQEELADDPLVVLNQTEPSVNNDISILHSNTKTTSTKSEHNQAVNTEGSEENNDILTTTITAETAVTNSGLEEDKTSTSKERLISNDLFRKFIQRTIRNISTELNLANSSEFNETLEVSSENKSDKLGRGRRDTLPSLSENEILKDSEVLQWDKMLDSVHNLDYTHKDLVGGKTHPEPVEISSNKSNEMLSRSAQWFEYDDYSGENNTARFDSEEDFSIRSTDSRYRSYYIAAEEILWDYGITKPPQLIKSREMRRGMRKYLPAYRKVVFRAYQDENFQHPVKPSELDEHLGIMGPVLKAEINDVLVVVFKNLASRPYSLHLHGVYDKTQGGPATGGPGEGPRAWEAPGDPVPPGEKRLYNWRISTRQGPSAREFDCKAGAYYSNLNMEKDINSGLIGPLLICRPGTLHPRVLLQPNVMDLFLLFTVFDETKSWYLEHNIKKFCLPPCQARVDDPWFKISNKFAAINGYVAETLPGLVLPQYQTARWHLLNVAAGGEFHAVHFHGLPFSVGRDQEHRMGIFNLYPGVFGTVEMRPTMVGTWLVECNIGEHQFSGMRAKLLVYNPRCIQPLGMQSGRIADGQITESDHYGDWESRLGRLQLSSSVNAWMGNSDTSWIQVDLLRPMLLHGIQSQGAKTNMGLSESFCISYTLSYSLDQETWRPYRGNSTRPAYVFTGNRDGSTIKENLLSPPLIGRYIRVHPLTVRKQPTLRLELLGCDLNSCWMPLGMQRGLINSGSIRASSFLKTWMLSWRPELARLHLEGRANAWRPKSNNPHEWIQVDFRSVKRVTGVITQGARSMLTPMMVTEFTVSISDNGQTWTWVTEEDTHREKLFEGNTAYEEEMLNMFEPPLFAQFVRIHPKGWVNDIAIRLEFLGCDALQRL